MRPCVPCVPASLRTCSQFLDWYGMRRDDVVSVTSGTAPLPNHFTAGMLFTEHLDSARSRIANPQLGSRCPAAPLLHMPLLLKMSSRRIETHSLHCSLRPPQAQLH